MGYFIWSIPMCVPFRAYGKNYLVTTTDILSDWSEPIFLTASGFDGSMFHDDDGRKWLLCMLLDHRKGKFFGGIVMQEYDPKAQRLVGKQYHIFDCTELGITEAPHLYKRNGWYYLITAEGGTEYGHAVTLARSAAKSRSCRLGRNAKWRLVRCLFSRSTFDGKRSLHTRTRDSY